MPLHPIADDRTEAPDLRVEASVVPRRETQCPFVEPHLGVALARVEAAVRARLHEGIDVRAELHVEEEREPRIEEAAIVREDGVEG